MSNPTGKDARALVREAALESVSEARRCAAAADLFTRRYGADGEQAVNALSAALVHAKRGLTMAEILPLLRRAAQDARPVNDPSRQAICLPRPYSVMGRADARCGSGLEQLF